MEHAPWANTNPDFGPAHAHMPSSWHTAWVRTCCSKAAVGAWFRLKEVDRPRAKRQKRTIDKNHRNSGNPKKFY